MSKLKTKLPVMIMESDYKLSGDKQSYLTRFLTGLRKYTIGSCHYSFCHCESSEEDIQLKALTVNLTVRKDAEMRGDEEDEEWKRRAGRADREMKKRLRYHFKSHIEKWTDENRRRFPWKIMLHLLLLVIVTTQVSGSI